MLFFLLLFFQSRTVAFAEVRKRAARSLIRGVAVRIVQGKHLSINLPRLLFLKQVNFPKIGGNMYLDLMIHYGQLRIPNSQLESTLKEGINKTVTMLELLLHQLIISDLYNLNLAGKEMLSAFLPLLTSSVQASGGEWHDGELQEPYASMF